MNTKDLLKLPIEARREEMERQCTPEIIHHYEVTCPECGLYYGGHATGGDRENGTLILKDRVSFILEAQGELRTVFHDGKLLIDDTLSEIRKRISE